MNTSVHPPLLIPAQPLPVSFDSDGVARVANTRVTLQTMVSAFLEGASAEEMAYQYPSISLSDIYAVISFYLRNQRDVDEYLRQRHEKNETIRAYNEERNPPKGIRERLLARRPKAK